MSTFKGKTLITSLLGLVLILALILTITFAFQTSEEQFASADAVIVSNHVISDGYIYDPSTQYKTMIESDTPGYVLGTDGRYHMTDVTAANVYTGTSKVYISTAEELVNFINTATSTQVGILRNNIDYNMKTLGLNGSTAIFKGKLEGNAYTINMTSPDGGSYLSYNKTRTGANDEYISGNYKGNYYSGMLCAINQGEINNCNFVWNSSLNAGSPKYNTQVLAAGASSSGERWTAVTGVVAGLNDNNGKIFNCTLTLEGAFAVTKRGGSELRLPSNASITGGICGLGVDNSIIERCTVNNKKGILGGCEGSLGNGTSISQNNKCIMIAGGIVGSLKTVATARVLNCSITGVGNVNGMSSISPWRNSKDGGFGYAGGAVGATVKITEENKFATFDLVDGQISGIVSSWTGTRTNVWWENLDVAVADRQKKSIVGCLFDDLGANAIPANLVILYDFISLAEASRPETQEPCLTLDCGYYKNITYGNWTEIYAKNSDGVVSVSYDYSKESDPIRAEVVATGYFDEYEGTDSISDDFTSAQKNFLLSETTSGLGKFIFNSRVSEIEHGVDSGYRLFTYDYVGARVERISPNLKGAVTFTFGEVVDLSYAHTNTSAYTENFITNTSKYYNGEQVNAPRLVLTRKNGENAAVVDTAYTYQTTYTLLDGFEKTGNSYPAVEGRYHLPGEYEFISKITITEDDGSQTDYAYYNTNSKVVAKFDETNNYIYDVFAGTNAHFVASCQSSSLNWVQQDEIKIGYYKEGNYSAGMIDYYTYRIGNAQESEKIAMGADAFKAIPITTTGKYLYNFNSYLVNPYEQEKTEPNQSILYLPAGSTSIQAFVDNEAPVIKNVKYYEYDPTMPDNKGLELLAADLQEWLINDVLITYTVTDNNLSGISSGSGQTTADKVSETRWECTLILNGTTNSQKVIYVDQVGNSVERTFSAKVDTTPTALDNVITLNYSEYLGYYADLGACPKEVFISFTPRFGNSGARLEYSYELDEHGNEIWVVYNGELERNIANTFKVDFDIINSHLKMRLVNEEGLYETSYANGDGYVRNGDDDPELAKVWSIKIVIAYIGVTLKNVYIEGADLTTKNLSTLFAKTYDGTDSSTLPLSMKVYEDGTTTARANTSIIYTELYNYTRPDIVESDIRVNVKYESKDVGSRKVSLTAEGVGESKGMYLIYFTDGTVFDDYELLSDQPNAYDAITANINPFVLNVNLSAIPDQLKTSYIYGEEIPSEIVVAGAGEEMLSLNLVTDAKVTYDEGGNIIAYPNANVYNTGAEFKEANSNYILNVQNANVAITSKAMVVKTTLDDKVNYSANVTFNGMPHILAGTYVDVFGVTQNATVKYYRNATCTGTAVDGPTGVKEVGTYYAKLTIDDNNYSVSNTGSIIQFSIIKAYLNLDLTEQQYEFINNTVAYEIRPEGNFSTDTYQESNFTIKYYDVTNGAPNLDAPLDSIKNVGRYLVDISISGNSNFFDREYADTYITINKASTQMTADDVVVTYDGLEHTLNPLDVNLTVIGISSNSTVIGKDSDTTKYFDLSGSAVQAKDLLTSGVFELYYYDSTSRNYILVDDVNRALNTEVGLYSFRLQFKGDQNFNHTSLIVTLRIEEAKFEGIDFESKTVNRSGDEKFTLEMDASEGTKLKEYLDMGATLVYTYNEESRTYGAEDYTPFEFINVGQYLITAQLSMPNYQNFVKAATLTVDKTAMTGVEPDTMSDIVYDGEYHPATFGGSGFVKNADGSLKCKYYQDDKEAGFIEYVYYKIGEEEIKVYVDYDDNAAPLDVGEYNGVITFTSDEYATTTINTYIKIVPQQVDNIDWTSLETNIKNINSATDISRLGAMFTDNAGNKMSCKFAYYNEETNERVELSSKGTLPAGKYIVKIEFNNGNYTTTKQASLEIKDPSSSGGGSGGNSSNAGQNTGGGIMDMIMSNIMYIGIGAGALVVIIVIAVVVGSKSKKGKKKGKKKAKAPQKKKPTQSASSKDKATF